jgi:plastocyanin
LIYFVKIYDGGVMQSKAAQIAALLRGKAVFYVNVEIPDDQGSITETTLEDPEGIAVSAAGDTVTFTANDKTVSFAMLENAQILTNEPPQDKREPKVRRGILSDALFQRRLVRFGVGGSKK